MVIAAGEAEMRRIAWMIGLLAVPLAACSSDAANNSRSLAYLVDSPAQIPEVRRQALQPRRRALQRDAVRAFPGRVRLPPAR